MATEAHYTLLDRERKIEITWPINASAAVITTYPEREYIGVMGVLMTATPHITQFQFYVESIIDQVLEGYANHPSPVAEMLKGTNDGA